MDWEAIWQKIQEFAINFYHFAMNEGENKFMLVDTNLLNGNNVPNEVMYFFIGSFVVMILLAILACDSFQLFHPIEGIREWKSKISIVQVVFFAAAVFSFHTFYKMLITLAGGMIGAQASISSLRCLGTYINPISVMIYAYAVSTMTFRKKNIQALFLGWAIFLTPAAMSYSTFTREHIMLYSVAASFGIVGAILYKRCSPYISYFIMSVIYLICKFFMLYYSEEMLILTADSWGGKIAQFFACEQMDIILLFLLLLILLGYKEITTDKENLKIKKDVVFAGIVAILLVGSVVSNQVVEVHAVQLEKIEPNYYVERSENNDTDAETSETDIVVLDNEPVIVYVITADVANIRSGPSTDYEIIGGGTKGDVFYGTGNEEQAPNGKVWYEIYINAEQTEVGWASSAIIEKREEYPINRLLGTWHGEQGSELTLNEDGSCYYKDGSSGEGQGTWMVDEYAYLRVNSTALNYEIYAILNDGYDTSEILMESDSGNWRNETFSKE